MQEIRSVCSSSAICVFEGRSKSEKSSSATAGRGGLALTDGGGGEGVQATRSILNSRATCVFDGISPMSVMVSSTISRICWVGLGRKSSKWFRRKSWVLVGGGG